MPDEDTMLTKGVSKSIFLKIEIENENVIFQNRKRPKFMIK